MPDKLTFSLLGAPQIQVNGRSLHFRSVKAVALLAYLATTGMLHERAEIAALLWPESDNKRARGALRYTLSLIKKEVGEPFLLIQRRQIGLNPAADWEADVVVVRQRLATLAELSAKEEIEKLARLEEGVAHYQAEFLQGFTLPDSEPFNEWVWAQRAALQRDFATSLKQLVAHYQAEQQWDSAIDLAHRWLDLNPLHEPAHCQLLTLYAEAGNWTAVQHQYQALTDLLQAELGVLPQPETAALYQSLSERRKTAVVPTRAPLSPDERSRVVLIEKVRRFWVAGLLRPIYEQNEFIQLKLSMMNEMIDHPWEDVLDVQQTPTPSDIVAAFRHADRALLVLGEAGAGKTVSVVALAKELLRLAEKDRNQPVPVILSLSGWAERQQPLEAWAVEELVAKYQIPRRTGRQWVGEERLLFLLDGLDEMAANRRADCIQAINTYRQTHGLAAVAVCCRQEAYETAVAERNSRLQLNGAVRIRPLTTAQIRQHAPPDLVQTIFDDETLLDIAQSPLNLKMMQTAFSRQSDAPQPAEFTLPILFEQYVQQMVQRQSEKGAQSYPEATLTTQLTWLARQMQRHNQAIFLLEQLQPSWLDDSSTRLEGQTPVPNVHQWLYLLLTRPLIALFFGAPMMWSFVQLIRINPPYIELNALGWFMGRLGITAVSLEHLVALMLLNLLCGGLAALLDLLFFNWRRRQQDEAKIERRRGVLQLLTVSGAAGLLMTLLIARTDPWPLALFLGGLEMLGIAIVFGYVGHGQSYRTEVRLRGAMRWSWRSAAVWGASGAVISLLWSMIIWLNDPTAVSWQLNLFNNSLMLFLLGGVSGKQPAAQSRPNEGMKVAAQNGALAFVCVAVPMGVLTAVTVNLASGLYTGLLIGLAAGAAYGFNDVAKHLTIRLLLWLSRATPQAIAPILDYAVDCALLQRVGGGYTFRHHLLLDYFARRDAAFERSYE